MPALLGKVSCLQSPSLSARLSSLCGGGTGESHIAVIPEGPYVVPRPPSSCHYSPAVSAPSARVWLGCGRWCRACSAHTAPHRRYHPSLAELDAEKLKPMPVPGMDTPRYTPRCHVPLQLLCHQGTSHHTI